MQPGKQRCWQGPEGDEESTLDDTLMLEPTRGVVAQQTAWILRRRASKFNECANTAKSRLAAGPRDPGVRLSYETCRGGLGRRYS